MEYGLLPGRMFPGGPLKGGISIRQVPGGTGRPDFSTASFLRLRGKRGGERIMEGWFVVLGGVWHTVGSWNNNVPVAFPLVGGVGVLCFVVFPCMTGPPGGAGALWVLVFSGGVVCGGVVV